MAKKVNPTKGMIEIANLSPDEIDLINSVRSPSERVGQWQERCGAKNRPDPDTGEIRTCRHMAGMGTTHPGVGHCKHHGGNTPAGNKYAARKYAEKLLGRERERFGGNPELVGDISPAEALLEEVRRSVALVRWLEQRIAMWQYDSATPEEQLGWERLGGLPALMAETARGASSFTDEREWLMIYREERKHMASISKMAIDAGVQERLVRLAEDQGRLLASAIQAVLDALNLTPAQHAIVPQVVPVILRKVASGDATFALPKELAPVNAT